MTPGPMDFRESMALKGPMRGLNGLHRAHRNEIPKTFFLRSPEFEQKKRFNFGEDLFFFWRSLENPEKSVPFFLPVLDCTKPEMRNIGAVPGP